jgi:hypothetical protein
MAEEPATTRERLERARREYLTPELRDHFEHVGITGVQFDAMNHRYSTQEKRDAAWAWLKEKREEEDRRATCRFLLIFSVALAGLLATLYTIFGR